MSSALRAVYDKAFAWCAVRYQAAVARELKKYGLRFDDLLDEDANLDVKEAMRRIPQEEIDARHQRIKRAMDVSLKKSYLPKHVQDLQTPYAGYLSEAWDQVKLENQERSRLGTGRPYDRPIP